MCHAPRFICGFAPDSGAKYFAVDWIRSDCLEEKKSEKKGCRLRTLPLSPLILSYLCHLFILNCGELGSICASCVIEVERGREEKEVVVVVEGEEVLVAFVTKRVGLLSCMACANV